MGTQNWMGSVPDDVYLSQLSIPGTHDTLTFNLWFILPEAQDQDQSFDIAAQLNAGIRYFDLRLVVDWSDGPFTPLVLRGFHGEVIPNTDFVADILQPTVTFLTNNRSECVIFQLTNNGSTMAPPINPSWDELLDSYILNNQNNGPNLKLFYTDHSVPTLGEVRGMIVLADADSHGSAVWGGSI
jgi:1-phosphatidylinositol phosphodiesterase